MRPFVRVAGNLSLSVSELSANIPAFNPQKMLLAEADGDAPARADEAPPTPSSTPKSRSSRATSHACCRARRSRRWLPIDDVLTRVREAANWTGNRGSRRRSSPTSMPATPTGLCGRSDHGDPYAGFEARIVPENITLLPKTTAQATGGNAWNERTIALKKGDIVAAILRDLGATPGRDQGDHRRRSARAAATAASRKATSCASCSRPAARSASARSRSASSSPTTPRSRPWSRCPIIGKYVAVDVRSAEQRSVAQPADDEEDDGKGVRLYQSIYETALRNQVPRPVIDDLIRIYSYDVDFQRKVQPGDSFEVLFAGEDENATDASKTEVLFASLTTGGETRKFYRFQSPDDGVVDYYDETGKSAKKFLVRKPLADGIMRSGFGIAQPSAARLHQDAHRRGLGAPRWARRSMPPATASIEKVGWEGGYGKYIRIRHANGYETAYGHMSAFARGMDAGQARAPGPGDRLCRLDRPLDRRAPALRNPGQRPLRRPDAHQAAARPRAGRDVLAGFEQERDAARQHDDRARTARASR